jgi:hypothetical protein
VEETDAGRDRAPSGPFGAPDAVCARTSVVASSTYSGNASQTAQLSWPCSANPAGKTYGSPW